MTSKVNSTPSKNAGSTLSQAGNRDYRLENIHRELQEDIGKSEQCDFDDLVRYHMSRCLIGENKVDFEKLQGDIEDIQSQRFYPPNATQVQEPASEQEKELVARRDGILKDLYDQALCSVLDVANDVGIKGLLKEFVKTFKLPRERNRYVPYTELCNGALNMLKDNGLDFLRQPDPELDLVYHVNDPKVIKSNVGEGLIDETHRKPDGVGTSRNVARRLKLEHLTQPSTRIFEWYHILDVVEFKDTGAELSDAANKLLSKNAKFGTTRQCTISIPKLDGDLRKVEEPLPSTSASGAAPLPRSATSPEGSSHAPSLKRSRNASTDLPSDANVKRSKTSAASKPTNEIPTFESSSKKAVDDRIQVATYALEMMGSRGGVHHVLCSLIIDEYLWLWYFDRQGIIRANAISIVADFPRFLVLLLILQRFKLEDWGTVTALNPNAVKQHSQPDPARFGRAAKNLNADAGAPYIDNVSLSITSGFEYSYQSPLMGNDMTISMKKHLSNPPRCLAGRATAVLSAVITKVESQEVKLACKLSNPEVQRPNEGKTLRFIHKLCDIKAPDMKKYAPKLYFHGDMAGTGTRRIRSVVHIDWKGDRVLRVLVVNELERMTVLRGEAFVHAWLEALTFHSFLWKHGVEHGDPSLFNTMYDPDENCGILTDYDLSIFQWLPRIPGTDRTGTVPFMAIDLLCKEYWDGQVQRFHHHELEAFIWILPFVFLRYQDSKPQCCRAIDAWITSDYTTCGKEKSYFYQYQQLRTYAKEVQTDYKSCWWCADALCQALNSDIYERGRRLQDEEQMHVSESRTLAEDSESMATSFEPDERFHLEASNVFWERFLRTLGSRKHLNDIETRIECLREHAPSFVPAFQNKHHEGIDTIYNDLN